MCSVSSLSSALRAAIHVHLILCCAFPLETKQQKTKRAQDEMFRLSTYIRGSFVDSPISQGQEQRCG